MNTSKLMLPGAAAIAIGAALLGLSFASPQGASAGNIVPCDSTPVTHGDSVSSLIADTPTNTPTDTPIPTCTPVKLKTHTPTNTATAAATQTPVPVTPAPTQPAATATQPGGGAGGQQVLPPNTGTGAMAAGSGIELPFLVAGMLLLVLGGGSILVGARRRS